jgi:hypothetical protein
MDSEDGSGSQRDEHGHDWAERVRHDIDDQEMGLAH